MMNRNKVFFGVGMSAFILMLLGWSLPAAADGYVTLTKNNSYTSGFAGAAWSESVADPSTRDYRVDNNRTFYTAAEEVVNAHSLTFGVVNGKEGRYCVYYPVTFNNEGLIFANGYCYLNMSGVTIGGKVEFTSPASAPYRFYGSSSRDRGLTFLGKATSSSNAGILAHSTATNFYYLAFEGDTSDFLGSVVVTSQYNAVGAPSGAELRLSGSASYFGGSIDMRDGTTLRPQIATSVGSLALGEGSSLSLTVGSVLTVRTALTVGGGPVRVELEGSPSSAVLEATRHALVAMPAASACALSDFALSGDFGVDPSLVPELTMEESGGVKTLYACYYPVVTLTTSNKGSGIGDTSGESAVGAGGYWSDGEPVHSQAHYQVNKLSATTWLTLPYDQLGTNTFPGASLKMGNNTVLQLRTGDYTVSNMTFMCGGGGCTVYGLDNAGVTLRSDFSVDGNVSFGPRKGGTVSMSGPIWGSEGSLLNVCGSAAGASQCRGIVVLDGDNSGYAGKMLVTLDYPPNLSFDTQFMSLRVSKAAALGGPRSEFAYDALKLENAGRLEAYGTFTLDEPTRGVFVSGQGRFYVAPDETLAVKEQLTVNGRVYKEGEGTLALGGAVRYIGSGGDVTDVPPADAADRTLYVTGGRIKPLSAYALDGLDVVFSNLTSNLEVGLAMDVAPSDATLLERGICNASSSAPFSWQNGDTSTGITIRLDYGETPQLARYAFAVMTLSSDVADSVFSRVRFIKPAGFANYGIKTRRTYDAAANTVTLHASLECGLTLTVF